VAFFYVDGDLVMGTGSPRYLLEPITKASAIAGLLALLVLVCAAGSVGGQAPARWRRSVYPSGVSLSGNTGPQVGVGFGYVRRADSLANRASDASLAAAGGYGWRGSWFASLTFRAPGLWSGWRVVLTGLARRQARFEFAGLGNASLYDARSVNDTQPYFYKLRRTRYLTSVEGTRAIRSGLSVALAVGISHAQFDSLPGPSLFASTLGPEVHETDQTARLSLVLDRRNNEYDTRRGFLVEVGATAGTAGRGYSRFTSLIRAYAPLGTRACVALRLAGTGLIGHPPLSARFDFPVWEGSMEVLGAPASHRGLRSQRFVGRHMMFGNAELRHRLLRWRLLEVVGSAFVDVGRVFENESFALTVRHLKFGEGLGLGVRKGKALILLHAARGPDGIVVSSRSGWMF
jgi:outer membrane protein assembly factor BamA